MFTLLRIESFFTKLRGESFRILKETLHDEFGEELYPSHNKNKDIK